MTVAGISMYFKAFKAKEILLYSCVFDLCNVIILMDYFWYTIQAPEVMFVIDLTVSSKDVFSFLSVSLYL
jgi:hypothetical protein